MTDDGLLVQIGLRIAGLSLIAVGGGNALIPALHDTSVVQFHWLSDARFTETVGLAQIAPGPNMLLIPLIGWQTAGIAGAAVALFAFLVPSSFVAVLGSRWLTRNAGSAAVRAFTWALRPVTAGLMLSSSVVLLATAAQTWPQPSRPATLVLVILAASVAVLSVRYKANPLVWLAAAALIGVCV